MAKKVNSDFNIDIDGWTFSHGSAKFIASSGVDGTGGIYHNDSTSNDEYLIAPDKFLGNLFGKFSTLSFDLALNSGNNFATKSLLLTGNGKTIKYDFKVQPTDGTYYTYTIDLLSPTSSVTPAVLEGILSNVTKIQIPIDYGFSYPANDEVYIDNINLAVVCFTSGTLIDTPNGELAIENLCVGDMVSILGSIPARLRWIGKKTFLKNELEANSHLYPVRICAGALGGGFPQRDLLVSRQHRMLVTSNIAGRMFGKNAVLISAIRLTELDRIYVDYDVTEVEYFHLLFDKHEIVIAEGCPSESLFTGPEALRSVPEDARLEILEIFPNLQSNAVTALSAAHIPSTKLQKRLISRHRKNGKPMIDGPIQI